MGCIGDAIRMHPGCSCILIPSDMHLDFKVIYFESTPHFRAVRVWIALITLLCGLARFTTLRWGMKSVFIPG